MLKVDQISRDSLQLLMRVFIVLERMCRVVTVHFLEGELPAIYPNLVAVSDETKCCNEQTEIFSPFIPPIAGGWDWTDIFSCL